MQLFQFYILTFLVLTPKPKTQHVFSCVAGLRFNFSIKSFFVFISGLSVKNRLSVKISPAVFDSDLLFFNKLPDTITKSDISDLYQWLISEKSLISINVTCRNVIKNVLIKSGYREEGSLYVILFLSVLYQ